MKLKKFKLTAALISLLILVGCGSNTKDNLNEKVLVYGSHNYTSINPALYEHGEINYYVFLYFFYLLLMMRMIILFHVLLKVGNMIMKI